MFYYKSNTVKNLAEKQEEQPVKTIDYAKLREYENFKGEVESMIRELEKAIESIEKSKNNIGCTFTINDFKADNNKITELYNSLVDQRNYLQNSCIPSINSKINDIKTV